MTEVLQNFEIYQGDNKEITFVVRDEADELLDLTGYTLSWVMYNMKSKEVFLTKTQANALSVPTPSNGQVILTLEPEDTLTVPPAKYQHELEITDVSGIVSTVTTGVMTVFYSRA